MARSHDNLAVKEREEAEPRFVKANQKTGVVQNANEGSLLAKECLRHVSTKEIALRLGLSYRIVQAWAQGIKPIPHNRIVQIITITKGFFLDQSKVENAIDRTLLMQYGPHAKGGF